MDPLYKTTTRHFSDTCDYSLFVRRQSVTPSGNTIRRNTYEKIGPETRSASTGTDLFASFLGIKRNKSLRAAFCDLLSHNSKLANDLKQLCYIMTYLRREYENSQHLNLFSQYRRLNVSIKRAGMLLQSCAVHSTWADDLGRYYNTDALPDLSDLTFRNALQKGSVISSHAKEEEALRQRQEIFDSRFSYSQAPFPV